LGYYKANEVSTMDDKAMGIVFLSCLLQ
jgi:hypothetical protein